VTVGASPFVYANAQPFPVTVLVSGGTVTAIEISRNSGSTWTLAGLLGGQYSLQPNDQLRVTYAVIPSLTMIPGT
jgi:hypothetical protein